MYIRLERAFSCKASDSMLFSSGQLAFGKFFHHAVLGDDHAVHWGTGGSPEGGDGIRIQIIADAEGTPLAVEEALTAALAVFRICNHRFVCLLVEIKNIHRTNVDAIFTSDA